MIFNLKRKVGKSEQNDKISSKSKAFFKYQLNDVLYFIVNKIVVVSDTSLCEIHRVLLSKETVEHPISQGRFSSIKSDYCIVL